MKKRSVSISGHRTSISLEEEFWNLLGRLARLEERPLAQVIAEVDRTRMAAAASGQRPRNLSSSLRVHVLNAVLTGRLSGTEADPPGKA